MGENRTDYQHRRRRPVHPQYEQEQRRGSRTERLREQRYAEEEMRMQQEQRRRVGARMQRNHQKQMEMRRRRKRGEIILCVLLVVILAGAFGAAKLYASLKLWEGKAEKSDFVASADVSTEAKDQLLNIALLGTDGDGFRSDVNMVASLNLTTKEVHLISVPRDTRVVMTDDMIAGFKSGNRIRKNTPK